MLQHIGLTGSEKLDALAVCQRGNWLYADLVEGCAICCPDIRRNGMLGAVAGDIIGSVYEFHPAMSMDFPLLSEGSAWTDDTVLTMVVAEALQKGRPYEETLREFALEHPDAGFGGRFRQWFTTPGSKPYNSFGNGSAMRVSPVGWAFDTLEETLEEAQRSADVTDNHPEGIKGAQSVVAAIFVTRQGGTQTDIRDAFQGKYVVPRS